MTSYVNPRCFFLHFLKGASVLKSERRADNLTGRRLLTCVTTRVLGSPAEKVVLT